MITPQAQIKINLPLSLKEFLESRAAKFGIPIAGYVKHLIIKDVSEMELPVFQASTRTERKTRKALREIGKSILVKDIDKFFDNL